MYKFDGEINCRKNCLSFNGFYALLGLMRECFQQQVQQACLNKSANVDTSGGKLWHTQLYGVFFVVFLKATNFIVALAISIHNSASTQTDSVTIYSQNTFYPVQN